MENYPRRSVGGGLTGRGLCFGGGRGCVYEARAVRFAMLGSVPNGALCSVTHPSLTSNVGPTARRLSCYVDVVIVGRRVIFPQSDGRLRVVLVNSQQDLVSLSSSCAGNRYLSVHDNVLHEQKVNVPLCSLGNTKPGRKVPGLSSEDAVRRHRAAQARTVK